MYRSCIFCSAGLGANLALPRFPVGRTLAFDAAKGRLWVVCPKCARWNLTPLEERWEARFEPETGPPPNRLVSLALEMALHEETERRALDGELAMLTAMWREAEEIAAIADRLPDQLPAPEPPRIAG